MVIKTISQLFHFVQCHLFSREKPRALRGNSTDKNFLPREVKAKVATRLENHDTFPAGGTIF